MALSNTHLINPASYEALRLAIMGQLEGNSSQPYYDSANPPLVTIGIGFNISDSGMRLAVFNRMGITDPAMQTALTNVITSGTYNGNLISDLPDGNNPGQRNYELRAALDAAYGSSFFMTPQQIAAEFSAQATTREGTITGVAPKSLEMIAVLSAEYNNVYGPGLQLAIAQDNRAEAWYELCYRADDVGSACGVGQRSNQLLQGGHRAERSGTADERRELSAGSGHAARRGDHRRAANSAGIFALTRPTCDG